jgi:hypothetical protein
MRCFLFGRVKMARDRLRLLHVVQAQTNKNACCAVPGQSTAVADIQCCKFKHWMSHGYGLLQKLRGSGRPMKPAMGMSVSWPG